MSGINDLFALGKRAMVAQQVGMQVTSNNISNAQNPDYAREEVQFAADLYLKHANFTLGAGVRVENVRRLRDQFYDLKYWTENANMSRWETEVKYGKMVESSFTDLTGTGFSQLLDDFWNGWMEVGNHPQDISQRKSLVVKTQQLIDTFHNLDAQLRSVSNQAKENLEVAVKDLNRLLTQIAHINKQVSDSGQGSGLNNTLLDQRDALISELSKYIDVDVNYEDNGTITLTSNYQVIVDEVQAFHFSVKTFQDEGQVKVKVVSYGDQDFEFSSGSLKSLMNTINVTVPKYVQQLDAIAKALVENVNQVHRQNYNLDGDANIDFFFAGGKTAGSIQLSQAVANSIWNIAVSQDGQAGDGNGALDIFNIRDQQLLENETQTINGAFRVILNQVGEDNQLAEKNYENQSAMVNVIDNQRQAIMGVSIDEEMVNLMKFQTAFGAASRIISSVDEMMQTILNMV